MVTFRQMTEGDVPAAVAAATAVAGTFATPEDLR